MNILFQITGHLYNLIYVIGFLIKNILWLRVVMIVGAFIEAFYSYFIVSKPLWVNIFWCGIWILVNSYQLFFLIRERLNLKFTEKESILYKLVFTPLSEINYKKILKIARWDTIVSGTVLVEDGVVIDRLILIYSGVAKVEANNNIIAYLGDGNFVGEMSFITHSKTTAKVTAVTDIVYLCWNNTNLNELLSKSKELEEGLKTCFNLDLVKKLTKENIEAKP